MESHHKGTQESLPWVPGLCVTLQASFSALRDTRGERLVLTSLISLWLSWCLPGLHKSNRETLAWGLCPVPLLSLAFLISEQLPMWTQKNISSWSNNFSVQVSPEGLWRTNIGEILGRQHGSEEPVHREGVDSGSSCLCCLFSSPASCVALCSGKCTSLLLLRSPSLSHHVLCLIPQKNHGHEQRSKLQVPFSWDFAFGSQLDSSPVCKERRKWWKWGVTGEGDVIPLGRNKEKTWVLLSATSRTQKNWLVGTEHPENSLEKANGITGHTDNLNPYFNVDLSSKYVHVTTKEEREREGKKSECESEKQNSCPRIHLKWVEKIGRENSIWQHDRKYNFYHMGNFNMNF